MSALNQSLALRGQSKHQQLPQPPSNEFTAVALEVQKTLTRRELEVLRQIAFGLSDKEVAYRLHISPTTVHKYAARVYAKLGARNRVMAVVTALRQGLVQL